MSGVLPLFRRSLVRVWGALVVGVVILAARVSCAAPIEWREWSKDVLAEARVKNQHVLVNGFSARCPWCRKMRAETFADRGVQELVAKSFIPVQIDLMRREEAPPRFRELIPPTTIVLSPSGEEIVSHVGFLTADELKELLSSALTGLKVRKGERVGGDVMADARGLRSLVSQVSAQGWEVSPRIVEFQVARARSGEDDAEEWIHRGADEAVAQLNAGDGAASLRADVVRLRILLAEYRLTRKVRFLEAANKVALRARMRFQPSDGAFAVSGRMPRGESEVAIAVEMIRALLELFGVTGDRQFLNDAERVTQALGTQLEKSTSVDRFYLGSSMLDMLAHTGDRKWLLRATAVVGEMRLEQLCDAEQRSRGGAGRSSVVSFARLSNTIFHYTGDVRYKVDAREVAACLLGETADLTVEEKVERYVVNRELTTAPVHISVVGSKEDSVARDLWRASLRESFPYLRREWLDKKEGAPPNPDVAYPPLSRSAAFVCANKRCSLPLFTQGELEERMAQIVPLL